MMKKENYLKPTIVVVGVELNEQVLLYTSASYDGGKSSEDIEKGSGGYGNDPYGDLEE